MRILTITGSAAAAVCFAAVLGAAALYALVPPESPFDLTAVPTDDTDESEVSAGTLTCTAAAIAPCRSAS